MLRIAIIVPVHNEEKNIETFIQTFLNEIKGLKDKFLFNICFCDDGSIDNTWTTIVDLKNKFKSQIMINGVKLSENFGKDFAIFSGLENNINADAVITIDGDLQHPINIIPTMLAKWKEEKLNILHFIRNTDNYSKKRSFFSKIFNKTFNYLTNLNLQPNITDFKLLDKKIFRKLISHKKRVFFYRGEVSKFNEKIDFIKSSINKRKSGESSFNFKTLILLTINYISMYSYKPLYLISLIGVIITLIGVGFFSTIIISLFFENNFFNKLYLILAFNLISVGVIILFLGILSFYIRNIYLILIDNHKNKISKVI